MPNKTQLNTFANAGFLVGANPLKRALWYLVNFTLFASPWFPFYALKRFVLRLFGASIGKGVVIKPRVNIKYPWKLSVGDFTWIGEQVWIDNLANVSIGAHCCVSQGAMLLTGNHNYKKPSFDLITQAIMLEDGAWIGAQSTVCPGVTVYSHAILTVGSVAIKSLDAYSIYQGNPATIIRERKL